MFPSPLSHLRHLRPLLLGLGLIAAASGAAAQSPATPAPLSLQVHNAGAASFHVNASVLSGPTETLVVDTGFTRADALRIAALVQDSGKPLRTIFISNADPDYYFGAEVLHALFPQARVLSTAAVREKIQAKLAGKLAFWGPKMGLNAPQQPVLPEVLSGQTLSVDGVVIEVRGTDGPLAHRPWLWIPSQRTVLGDIAVFNGLHVWTADTQRPAERAAWRAQLDEMLALQPLRVVPGHMAAGSAEDASAIRYTADYLARFETELAAAPNAAALIDAMRRAYPQAGLGVALDIGAKVNKGEMPW